MKKTSKRLAKPFFDQINKLLDEGNAWLDKDRNDKALESFQSALAILSKPHDDYEVSSLVYASIGDAHWFEGNFQAALTSFEEAQRIFGGFYGHYEPFLMLRMGQNLLCLSDEADEEDAAHLRKRAHELLSKAYAVLGDEIFDDEDPIFLEFAKAATPQ